MSAYLNDIRQVFQCDLPWGKLSHRNILVTGATGLIGGCFVDALMMNPQRDYNVFAAGRNEERAKVRFKEYINCKEFHFVKHDLMQPLQGETTYDFIIHAAGGAYPAEFSMHPVEVIRSNINCLANLMDYGLSHGMKRMLYVSTGEVYGEGDGRAFTEDYSGYVNINLSRSCYPSSKRAAETLCVSYASEYGADVVIARPCHVYGPNFTESDNRAFSQFIRNVLHGEDIVMKSTGEQFRSWCYVVDCISALFYILLKGENCNAYNVANPSSNISIKELAEIIAGYGGKKVVIEIPKASEKRGYNLVSKSVYCVDKLKSLGWSPLVDINTGVLNTIDYLRNNQ